ncbi:MAG: hypothetical protein HYZ53_06380 [Planctomycetes bacterium]|nr:hypothetical protein [Planctomycetota bacterium]
MIVAQDSNARWDLKVLDFGIAKVLEAADTTGGQEPSLTATGAVIGTLAYMSPEQADGQAVDVRSDPCSLGAVLYQCVTGRQPFTGENRRELLVKILLKPPPTFTACGVTDAELPGLEALVARAMAKNPSERPAAARAMRHGLEGLLGKGPVGPGKPPTSTVKPPEPAPALAATPLGASRYPAPCAYVHRGAGLWRALRSGGGPVGVEEKHETRWKKESQG